MVALLFAQIPAEQIAALDSTIKVAVGVMALVVPVFSAGAAWMAVKVSLNGMRSSVTRIETKVDKLVENDSAQDSRLSHLEATQDGHAGWIGRVERSVELRRDDRR